MATRKKTPKPDSTAEVPGDGRLDLRILRALRRIIQAVDIHSRKLASQYNITAPQLVALLSIVDYGPLSLSDIGRDIHLSNSTIVGILDRLEGKGLVRRERSTQDRRLVLVSATPAGETLVESAPSPLQDVLAHALDELPELERTAIALSLERIVELMEAKDLDAAPMLELGEMQGSTDQKGH